MQKLKFLLLLFIVVNASAQTKTPVVASDLMKIVTTNQIQISPDGSKAVTVVIRKAVKNENEYYYTRHLYLLDLVGNEEPRQLTFGDKNDGQPQWSPDGKTIAFVRTDGDKSQIWLLPMQGGEASVITKAEFGATRPRWSPDGKKILFASSIPFYAIEGSLTWDYERPARKLGDEPNWKKLKADEKKNVKNSPDGSLEEMRAWLSKNAVDGNPRVLTRQQLQGELNLQPEEEFSHLFVKSLGADEKVIQLTSGYQDFEGGEWSPDGKQIVCHSKVYKIAPDDEQDTDLWMIDVAGKTAKEFLTWSGYSLSNAQFSPDGKKILFSAETVSNRHAPQTQLAVVNATGGSPLSLTATFDRDAGQGNWSADSKTIFFTAQTEGDIPLYSIAATGGKETKLFGNDNGVNDYDLGGDKVVYALTETKNPWELYSFNLKESGKPHKLLTQFNESWLKNKNIITPNEYWYTRPDGTKIQYWVMEPINKKEGLKYPTILNIHGGPSAMWGPGIFSMWHEYQLENSWGYGVVYCNPRGSGGYGDKFKKGNFKDWGKSPAGDILASLDEAMKQHAWIDKENLFVEGGSYAGYMVAWIVGHDHRFKAANAQRGVYDLTTFMGEGNAWRLVPDHFGGYPWQKETKALLDSESPLTYVDKIQTPLLIIHGDVDLRTGVIQSEMLYKSLKILNKPVEYIRYPKEGHELTRSGNPGRMMDHMLRVIEFFERYAKHPEK
ncbi:MAG: S9 family peptidase [Cyclobacteriaceae bacterium]|jgi:dipeptidyl aminopeptidase/acylaminoacyl peptidase|nr:S9 family peptidase [Flammeovirgaceae bacterium]